MICNQHTTRKANFQAKKELYSDDKIFYKAVFIARSTFSVLEFKISSIHTVNRHTIRTHQVEMSSAVSSIFSKIAI